MITGNDVYRSVEAPRYSDSGPACAKTRQRSKFFFGSYLALENCRSAHLIESFGSVSPIFHLYNQRNIGDPYDGRLQPSETPLSGVRRIPSIWVQDHQRGSDSDWVSRPLKLAGCIWQRISSGVNGVQ